MKKSFLLIVITLFVFSCKKDKSETDSTEAKLIRGEFILTNGAAVIMGKDFIYGVEVDNLTQELAKKVQPLQREEYDMVPVVIKGIVKANDTNGIEKWKEIVKITEIIGVSAPTSDLPTKINANESLQDASNQSEN